MYQQAPLNRERPLGITIIAAVMGILAVFHICGGLGLLISAPFLPILGHGILSVFTGAFAGIFAIVLAIINLIIAEGLWRLRPWAFWVTVVVLGINVLDGLFGTGGFFGLLVSGAILIYMFVDGNVRSAFNV
jgi:hypothetical protein